MDRRKKFLIVLLVLTAIPTVMFLIIFYVWFGFILRNMGDIRILIGDYVRFESRGEGFTFGTPLLFTGLILSCVIFFTSLFLLIRSG